MLLRAASVGLSVPGRIWHGWGARWGDAGDAEPVLGKAASRRNPRTGKENDAGLKKARVVFISYDPNDVFWIALLCG